MLYRRQYGKRVPVNEKRWCNNHMNSFHIAFLLIVMHGARKTLNHKNGCQKRIQYAYFFVYLHAWQGGQVTFLLTYWLLQAYNRCASSYSVTFISSISNKLIKKLWWAELGVYVWYINNAKMNTCGKEVYMNRHIPTVNLSRNSKLTILLTYFMKGMR